MSTAPINQTPSVNAKAPDQTLREKLDIVKNHANEIMGGVIKPSVKTFIDTCGNNPKVAAIVAPPAILALLLVAALFALSASALILASYYEEIVSIAHGILSNLLAFLLATSLFLLSASTLILWSVLKIALGVLLLITRGLVSLILKLTFLTTATIPFAGIAKGLLAGPKALSTFIIQNLPCLTKFIIACSTTFITYTAKRAQKIGSILSTMRQFSIVFAGHLHAAFEAANRDTAQEATSVWDVSLNPNTTAREATFGADSSAQYERQEVGEPVEMEGVLIPTREEEDPIGRLMHRISLTMPDDGDIPELL